MKSGLMVRKEKSLNIVFLIGGAVASKRAASWQMQSPLIVKSEAALGLL